MLDILLLQALYQIRLLRSKLWPVSGARTVGLFVNLSMLMLICYLSGRVSRSERQTIRKGLNDNNKRLLCVVNKFCIPFCREIKISICGGLDSDCTEVTLHRDANFRFKHVISDIEQTRRGITLLVLQFILPVLIIHYRFQ